MVGISLFVHNVQYCDCKCMRRPYCRGWYEFLVSPNYILKNNWRDCLTRQMLRRSVTANPTCSHMLSSCILRLTTMSTHTRPCCQCVGVVTPPPRAFFFFPNIFTKMLLVHLGPVMQIRLKNLQDIESSPLATPSYNLSASLSDLIRLLV